MDEKTITGQVHSSMYSQLQSRGYAAPVDVLMDAGVLSKEGYESWRLGKVDFLERVCKVNLRKLSEIMKTIRAYYSSIREKERTQSVLDFLWSVRL